jgi:hypothetical protein
VSSSPRSVVVGRYITVAPNEYHTLVRCPDNITLIAKSAIAQNLGGGPGFLQLQAVPAGSASGFKLMEVDIAAAAPASWDGHIVLGPGDSLLMFADIADIGVWVSGTVLQGVGVIPPSTQTLPGIPGFMPLTSL